MNTKNGTQPGSPAHICALLGVAIERKIDGSPAIVGSGGKRHYWSHGVRDSRKEMQDILGRLLRRQAGKGCAG